MTPDYRSDPAQSPEGKGLARAAWDSYVGAVGMVTEPVARKSLRGLATTMAVDQFGFWLAWHIHGGFEGLVSLGMHPTTVWRKVKRFRTTMGMHPDEYQMPGVTIDVEAYWEAMRIKAAAKAAAKSDQAED